MPAYRSAAEAEIRDAVTAKLREYRPGARIMHEINVSSFGPNRMDLIAVDRSEIIAVEIKSKKDKLDRLDAQVAAMKGCAHHVIAAVHEKFAVEQESNRWYGHYERDGKYYARVMTGVVPSGCKVWVYPEKHRVLDADYDHGSVWREPDRAIQVPLPVSALDMLHRAELYALCGILRLSVPRQANMHFMVNALRWYCNGSDLTRGICAMLRARRCVEADPEIIENNERFTLSS